jgi:uncharacterized oligopeptide transporter (OPT) family protein
VIAQPDHQVGLPSLIGLFVGLGVLGTLVGSALRRLTVRYQYPTGTACAIIQRTVTERAGSEEGRRPVRLLALWGTAGGIATLPTRIALEPGGDGLLPAFLNPLLFGVGVVVGPRIGIGLLLGALLGGAVFVPCLASLGVPEAEFPKWFAWVGSALLLLPSAVSFATAWRGRQKWSDPPGFEPGKQAFAPAPLRTYGAIGSAALAMTVIGAHLVFAIPAWMSMAALIATVPLCFMNARIAGDTDSNLISLVPVTLFSIFLFAVKDWEGAVIALLGVGTLGIVVVTAAVDMAYDYRAGYLINANPTQQAWVQLFGVLVGAAVAVPVVILLANHYGFGSGGLPAPMPRMFATMVNDFVHAESAFSSGLVTTLVVVSVFGCAYALLSASPRIGRFLPSLFGIGIGLIIGPPALTIFLGSMIKVAITWRRSRGLAGDMLAAAVARSEQDCLLAGSSVFAAAAIVGVFVIFWQQLQAGLGLDLFYLAR